MTDVLVGDLAALLVSVHAALDEAELARAVGRLVDQLAGEVQWQVRLESAGPDPKQVYLGGVGASAEHAPDLVPPSEGRRVELRFREDRVGELILEGAPTGTADDIWPMVGEHVGAAVVKHQLWAQAEDDARQRRRSLEMLEDISAVVGSLDIDYVLARSLEQVLKVVGSEVGSVMRWDGRRFAASVSLGLPEEIMKAIEINGRPAAEAVAEAGEPLMLRDPDLSDLPDELRTVSLSVVLLIPLTSGGRVVGVLLAADPRFGWPGSPYLEAAQGICRLAAVALENAVLHREAVQRERLVAIGQVMAGLSHDIKNMLQAMKSGYYLLKLGITGEDMGTVEESYPILGSAMDRVSGLVLDMLDYSKSRKRSREPADLNALAEEIVGNTQAMAAEKGVTVTCHPDADMQPLPIESTSIFRCLSNLVTNALEAVEAGGTVEVVTSWREGKPESEMAVRDNGPGIPEEDRERIFDALFTTKGSKGTGFGLAVTQKIVEEHGGQILLDSAPGRGTTFTIRLPKQV